MATENARQQTSEATRPVFEGSPLVRSGRPGLSLYLWTKLLYALSWESVIVPLG